MYTRDESKQRATPYATFILIALNALAFIVELSLTNDGRANLLRAGGVVPGEFYKAGANGFVASPTLVLTLLTAQFFQVGWWHFLTNLIALLATGPRVEEKFGRKLFALFYLASGASVFVLHIVIVGAQTLPVIGATGAVGAVLGAYVFLNGGKRVFIPLGRRGQSAPLILLVAFWLIAQWLAGFAAVIPLALGGSSAWWLPVLGLLLGFALARPIGSGLDWYATRRANALAPYNPYDNPDEEYRPPGPRTRAPYDNEDEEE